MKKVLISLLVLASFGFSALNVAVINTEIDMESAVAKEIKDSELRYITQDIRRQATNNLPRGKYRVMTDVSVQAQGEAVLQECMEENCMIALGEKIGADYIARGTLSKFRRRFTLTVEIYDTKNGMLVASSSAIENEEIDGLLDDFRKIAPSFFRKMSGTDSKKTTTSKTEKVSSVPSSSRFGIVGGVGLNQFKSNNHDYNKKPSVKFGVVWFQPITSSGELEINAVCSRYPYYYDNYYSDNHDLNDSFISIDIPVLYRHSFSSFYSSAGVNIGILISDYLLGGDDVSLVGDIFDVSLVFGAGWQSQSGPFFLGLKYFMPIVFKGGIFLEAGYLF
ncbi:MAG: hypothetical protein LBU89_02105 [Fibromonadaceae bacterium]|jgi:TolB-like protein|nr:hypothetical protein [Fibromonadaceae bacterium]